MNITYEDIKKFDSTYTYWSHAKDIASCAMSPTAMPRKTTIEKLIKKTSSSTPKNTQKKK